MQTSPGRSGLLLLVLSALVGSLSPQVAHAASIEVNSLADPGTKGCTATECTLREAIAAAQDGETITFDPALFATGSGTILLTDGALVLAKKLTIQGPGQTHLRIDGQLASRVFLIGASGVVTLTGMTIQRGHCFGCDGGGLRNKGTLTLAHSTISGNTASYGGGLYNAEGTLTLDHSTVSGNTTSFDGGGLYTFNGTLRLDHSTVSGNTASYGGGLYNRRSALRLHHSTVSDNTASGSGGGLHNVDGTLRLDYSTVSGNTAGLFGGGLQTIDSTLRLDHSTVSSNRAGKDGGGLVNAGGTLRLDYSTVSGNRAGKDGGGLYNYNGTLTLDHSTVSRNTAGRDGGGLYNYDIVQLSNTIVAGNKAKQRPDCAQSFAAPTLQSRGHNLTGSGTGCLTDPTRGDVTVQPALVFAEVLKLLRNNGGRTETHALRPGSPAVDAGAPATCSGTDQRGVPRPQGAGCDIGAFELEE